MSFSIYPQNLSKFIKSNYYIPKKLRYKSEIKQFAKYYCLEQSLGFKVEEVIEVSDQTYYQIRILDNNRQAVIPYEENFTYYELLTDRLDIKHTDSIINTNTKYFGSEIKYWFFIHKINLEDPCYKGFIPIISKNGKHLISDKRMYTIKANYNIEKNIYTNCKATVYKH